MTGIGKNGLADTVVPDGWYATSIGAHFEFKNGLNKAKEFFGYGTPIVNYMDVYRHPWLLPSHVSGKVDVTKNEQQAYSARQHDAFFTRTSETVDEIGMCAVLMEPIEDAVFSGFVLRARPLNDKLSSSFAAYALRGRTVRQQIESSATYTTRALTNGKSLSTVTFVLPPPNEQKRISAALKDIDDLIASLDALIAKKRDIKQAAMQQLLTGKTRLPGFDGEWVSSTVGQVCDVKTGPFGAQLHESDYVNDGTPIITVEHLGEFGVQIDEDVPLVSDADRRRLQNYSLRLGDIVFSRVGSIDRNALIGAGEEGWLFSGRLLRLRPEKTISSAFLSQIFHSDPFKELVRSVAVGQTMPSLNTKIVKALPILLPSKPEQDAIAQVFADIDGDLALSEARIAKAKGLKQGMMQQLLTGRIRLV